MRIDGEREIPKNFTDVQIKSITAKAEYFADGEVACAMQYDSAANRRSCVAIIKQLQKALAEKIK